MAQVIFPLITVRVINIENAIVHDFTSHTKSVVDIIIFSKGPLFASCGKDHTLRLYNLKYFQEIGSVRLKNTPLEMNLIDDNTLYIRTKKGVEIWKTNQMNINFTTMRYIYH
jgi:WD40 repeat protein